MLGALTLIREAGNPHPFTQQDVQAAETFANVKGLGYWGIFLAGIAAHPLGARPAAPPVPDRARGGGSVVNLVTSAMVRWDPTTYGSYAAAKSALRSLTRTAAVEWATDGIRVNCIAPGSIYFPGGFWETIKTNMTPMYEATLANCPFGRMGKPDEIAALALYLCSDEAGFVTGCDYPIDGGFTRLNT